MKTFAIATAWLVAIAGLASQPVTAHAATTFVVNRTGDAADNNLADARCDTAVTGGNQCTLRAAIQEANDTAGLDTINFNITSASKTIAPQTPLPTITGRVTINGYSQPNASTNTLATGNNAVLRIVLDGINVQAQAPGLVVESSNSVIRGLVIQRFNGPGIRVDGSGVSIRGNFVGTNAAGEIARGNQTGVLVLGSNNTVGGTVPATRNLISGNLGIGVYLSGLFPTGNVVAGNYIGTTKNGMAALGNSQQGVFVGDQSDCSIGTGTSGGGNVISGNGAEGVRLQDVQRCSVRGNRIGTNAQGQNDLGNAGGVQLIDAEEIVVGGATVPERNTIAGNLAGVGVSGGDVEVIGNAIISNDFSGLSFSGASTGIVQGNAIIGNATAGGHGLQMAGNTSVIRITANQFIANGGLGINLIGGIEDTLGVTANDSGDADAGPNSLQNYPTITSAVRQSNGLTTVNGQLNSSPNSEFRIELFLATGAVDQSSHGEGQALLAAQNITTNGSGNRSFTFPVGGLVAGHQVTMTAIRTSTGATSEFSLNVTVTQI